MSAAVQAEPRIHYMDNLRALTMLAGVVFHAALAYSPLIRPYWPLADAGGSGLVDVVAWFLHLFRIPLFFAVAGFFAALLVDRRGLAGLFRNRLARVLLPLLVFLPPLLWVLHGLTAHAVATVRNPSPVLAWLRDYVAEHGAMPQAFGFAHLWFLFYLLLFTLLVWVVLAMEMKRIGAWLARLSPLVLVAAMPLLLVAPLASVSVPWPAPEAMLPSLWALVYFGLHFGLGYQLYLRPALLESLRPYFPWLLLGAVAMYAALPWVAGGPVPSSPSPWRHVFHAGLEAYAGFWMTLWCLLAGKAWLAGSRPVMRWLSGASYWVYLVHLPVLFAIQYAMLDVSMHWTAKFALSTLATFAVSLLSYRLLVRDTLIGRLLNGGTGKARKPEASASAA